MFSILDNAIDIAVKRLGYNGAKDLQREILREVIAGRDVFAVLPTGYGKSLCYGCLPFLFDELYKPNEPTIVCVVSPLLGIIEDQVRSFSSKGVQTGFVTSYSSNIILDGVRNANYQLVFFTPEALLRSRWRKVLRSEPYSTRLRVMVIDEVHTVVEWGNTFRPDMLRLGEVRSIVAEDVKFMALTATASKELRIKVSSTLGLLNPKVIAISPCKSNIAYSVCNFLSTDESFGPILHQLRNKLTSMDRIIIYCRKIEDCSELYSFFKRGLGSNFTYPSDTPSELSKYRLVEMFTSVTDQEVKQQILKSFSNPSAPLRVVCATIAFGMGIDTPDVHRIIHFGAPNHLHSYIQETGRGGRDGKLTVATLLPVNKYNISCSRQILTYQKNATQCRRDLLFSDTDNYNHLDMGTKCLCCDICAISCDCGSCANVYSFN